MLYFYILYKRGHYYIIETLYSHFSWAMTARVMYYNSPGHSFPDNTECIRPAIPEGKTYPGAKLILTPPATPVPVTIDEVMVIRMQCEYKSHFPKESNDKQRS